MNRQNIITNTIRIGMLRQWLNEDRITDHKKMITNEEIISIIQITK